MNWPEEEAGLADGAVADDEQLEHVVEVLPERILSFSSLPMNKLECLSMIFSD